MTPALYNLTAMLRGGDWLQISQRYSLVQIVPVISIFADGVGLEPVDGAGVVGVSDKLRCQLVKE